MADWYCDYTNGDDTTGTGSSGSPFKTLQKGIDSATRGDNIWVANTSAQVLSSALTWNTGYNTTGSGETFIRGWDNGGALSINMPGVGDIPAGKIDASGLTVDWGNGSTGQANTTWLDLIIDSSNTANSVNGRSAWNFINCKFEASTKTGGYHITFPRNCWSCHFDTYGLTNCLDAVMNCVFVETDGYAVYSGNVQLLNNLFITKSTGTGSNPIVNPTGTTAKIIGNTVISKTARTGPLILAPLVYWIANNVLQGASGVGGSGIDFGSNASFSTANVFYDCTSNAVNDANVRYISPNIIGTAPLVTDAGTNEWEISSEIKATAFPKGFLETSTITYYNSGSLDFAASAGGGVRIPNIRGGADQ